MTEFDEIINKVNKLENRVAELEDRIAVPAIKHMIASFNFSNMDVYQDVDSYYKRQGQRLTLFFNKVMEGIELIHNTHYVPELVALLNNKLKRLKTNTPDSKIEEYIDSLMERMNDELH